MPNKIVTKPTHYTQYKEEVITSISNLSTDEEFEGYCKGNIIKYVSRFKHKNGIEDLEKAKAYLDFLINKQREINKVK